MQQAITYDYRGHQYTADQLAEKATNGITASGIRNRIKRGYSVHDAITLPSRNRRRSEFEYPCGATSWRDCLECKFKVMTCLSWPAMPGENAGNYVDAEYKKRSKNGKRIQEQSLY